MAQCPFCTSQIDEELARFGGHCPKCVIEIPGDETPTDPGIGKRVEEQVETERQRRWGVVAAVAALVLVVLVGAGSVLWWRIDQQRQADLVAQLEAEAEAGFYINPAEAHELPTLEHEQEQQVAQGGGAVHSPRGSSGGGTVTTIPSGSGSSKSNSFDFIGTSGADQPELAKLHERTIDVSPGADLGAVGLTVPQVSISRTGLDSVALSDPEEIRAAVGLALKAYSKQITTCYNRRLKLTPDLAGTWEVSFTIRTTGRTSNIGVVPQSTVDSALETCMRESIAAWTFQPMVQPQNFAKPYTFGVQ
jgi:hypothetical protein